MVIQRWQSVLLLCAAIMMACFTFCSLGQIQGPEYTLNFNTLGFNYEGIATTGGFTGTYMTTWYFFAISLLSAILPIINIFTYHNLRLQKRLCMIEVLLIFVVYAAGASLGYAVVPEGGSIGWSSICIAPLIALAADILAYRRIERDRQTLLAADRIR